MRVSGYCACKPVFAWLHRDYDLTRPIQIAIITGKTGSESEINFVEIHANDRPKRITGGDRRKQISWFFQIRKTHLCVRIPCKSMQQACAVRLATIARSVRCYPYRDVLYHDQ
jgi:hypothetical protein